jgi:hypothetical protein
MSEFREPVSSTEMSSLPRLPRCRTAKNRSNSLSDRHGAILSKTVCAEDPGQLSINRDYTICQSWSTNT